MHVLQRIWLDQSEIKISGVRTEFAKRLGLASNQL